MYKVIITINKNPYGKEIKEITYNYNCYYYYFTDNGLGLECEDSFKDRIYLRHQIVSLSIFPIK